MADTPAPDPLRLLTIMEVAKRLNVSDRTVERLVKRGHLAEPRMVGGSRRWFQQDVDFYIWRLMRGDFQAAEEAEEAERAARSASKKRRKATDGDTAQPKGDKPRQAPKRGSPDPGSDG